MQDAALNDPIVEYAATRSNPAAIASVVLGILAILLSPILIGGLIGIPAVILGLIGRAKSPPAHKARRTFVTGIQAGSLAIVIALLALTIWVPRIHRARERAEQTVLMVRLHQVHLACLMYADTNDIYPPHLALLVASRSLDPKLLRVPRNPAPPMPPPATPTDWTRIAPDVDAQCDYIYVLPGVETKLVENPPSTLFLYSRIPAGTNRIAAFADGHVESLPQKNWEELLKFANTLREKSHLPPLQPTP